MYRARRTAAWLLSLLIACARNVTVVSATPVARGTWSIAAVLRHQRRAPAEPRLAIRTVTGAPTSVAANAEAMASPAAAEAATPPACANAIQCENELLGVGPAVWDLPGKDAGDLSIQGFATDISVNRGQQIDFKIKTDATDYRLDIYRLGYYSGLGARQIDSISKHLSTPQVQPDCDTDVGTGLVDCGTWSVSASWFVAATAVSGIYLVKLVRTDTNGASHMIFVVRDDDGHSDLLFQTSDTTWQAYNQYGGNTLYTGSSAGRAYKVSYNRPFLDRSDADGGRQSWPLHAEYPMVRWLEANGYDVSYTTGVDTDRRGAEMLEHKVFMSVGHDEYWSAAQRANVEAARDNLTTPVNLAFFSGNAMFWKTRWEDSPHPTPAVNPTAPTPYRTLVCYKETHANAKIDLDHEWTGTWRDVRPINPEGPHPENAVSGTIFMVNGERTDSIMVPAEFASARFWRHTSIATLLGDQVAVLPPGTLGYEWDEDL